MNHAFVTDALLEPAFCLLRYVVTPRRSLALGISHGSPITLFREGNTFNRSRSSVARLS